MVSPKSVFGGIVNRAPLLCHYCHQEWAQNMPVFAINTHDKQVPLHASAYYDTPLKQAMTAFKDKGETSSLMVFYHLLRFMEPPLAVGSTETVLVPTPTTRSRLTERGFNPVLILAKYLSFLWQIPIWQGIARLDNVVHQRGLSRSDRLHNVKHDFYLTDTLPSRHVILIDDVVTTGSTLMAMMDAIWSDHPNTKIHAVCALHGRPDIHLPVHA